MRKHWPTQGCNNHYSVEYDFGMCSNDMWRKNSVPRITNLSALIFHNEKMREMTMCPSESGKWTETIWSKEARIWRMRHSHYKTKLRINVSSILTPVHRGVVELETSHEVVQCMKCMLLWCNTQERYIKKTPKGCSFINRMVAHSQFQCMLSAVNTDTYWTIRKRATRPLASLSRSFVLLKLRWHIYFSHTYIVNVPFAREMHPTEWMCWQIRELWSELLALTILPIRHVLCKLSSGHPSLSLRPCMVRIVCLLRWAIALSLFLMGSNTVTSKIKT